MPATGRRRYGSSARATRAGQCTARTTASRRGSTSQPRRSSPPACGRRWCRAPPPRCRARRGARRSACSTVAGTKRSRAPPCGRGRTGCAHTSPCRKTQHLECKTTPPTRRIRDIGILVVVFGPLDAFFQKERPSVLLLSVVVTGGLLFIALGIILEA